MVIPKNVTTIGKYPFRYCSNLEDIFLLPSKPAYKSYGEFKQEHNATKWVYADAYDAYIDPYGNGLFTRIPVFTSIKLDSDTIVIPLGYKRQLKSDPSNQGSGDRSLIRFCLGTAAGLRSAVANVSPLERLQRS